VKRTTISLPDDLAALLKDEASRRGTSVSEVVRSSVTNDLMGTERRSLPFAGLCDDRSMATGAELERELEEAWADDLERDRR